VNTTTRRYPRTLDEAFPGHDARYACAIERSSTMRVWERLLALASVGGCMALVVYALLEWAAA
jgi:hypothetical protein